MHMPFRKPLCKPAEIGLTRKTRQRLKNNKTLIDATLESFRQQREVLVVSQGLRDHPFVTMVNDVADADVFVCSADRHACQVGRGVRLLCQSAPEVVHY
jgi:hypothetical protein